MGLTITSTHPIHTFDMSCGGFFILRKNIALALDQEFGENYALLSQCSCEEDFKENYERANKIINRKYLEIKYSKDVIDFLYMSDLEGSISYKTCGKIYYLIKDVDFKIGFRYAAYMHNDFEEFKEFLLDCYSNRKKMRWY